MARISERLRQQVIDRARGCCEYCQTQQAIAVSMEVDHIIPEVNGGETHLDNLCYSCIGCNGFKLDFQTGIDPDTGHEVPLFHPRLERWADHFQWSDDAGMLIGKTPTARDYCTVAHQPGSGGRGAARVGCGRPPAALTSRPQPWQRFGARRRPRNNRRDRVH